MSCIYNERVKRNKIPFLALFVFSTVLVLVLSKLIKKTITFGMPLYIVDLFLIVVLTAMFYKIYRSMYTSFKYSLISNELIIHKIREKKDRVVNRINISDITDIEVEKCIFSRMKCAFNDCSCFVKNTYKITYQKNGETRKLHLRPSEELLKRLINQKSMYDHRKMINN